MKAGMATDGKQNTDILNSFSLKGEPKTAI